MIFVQPKIHSLIFGHKKYPMVLMPFVKHIDNAHVRLFYNIYDARSVLSVDDEIKFSSQRNCLKLRPLFLHNRIHSSFVC